MKVITIVNSHAGSGQTTVTVNLAAGLLAKGHRVLILDWGRNEKLRHWLGVELPPNDAGLDSSNPTTTTRWGVNLLSRADEDPKQSTAELVRSLQAAAVYDYLLIHPASPEYREAALGLESRLAICTDLEHPDELGSIQALQQCLSGDALVLKPVDLIISNKINTKEWEHTSQQLFGLGDYYGYRVLADPIPHCERIHDLPLAGRTVWELQQENLKSAFARLVETVEEL